MHFFGKYISNVSRENEVFLLTTFSLLVVLVVLAAAVVARAGTGRQNGARAGLAGPRLRTPSRGKVVHHAQHVSPSEQVSGRLLRIVFSLECHPTTSLLCTHVMHTSG